MTAYAPVQNFGVVPGFGMSQGDIGGGVAYTDDTGAGDDDASIGLAVGLGDPVNAVGLDLLVGIISTTDDFAQDGDVGVRLHRRLPGFVPGGASSVAVGVSRAARWGDADVLDPSYYGSFSTALPMPTGVTSLITVGYGTNLKDTNAFLERGVLDERSSEDAIFGSLGIGWNQYLDTSVSWDGDEVMAGLGIRPLDSSNLTLTLGIGDITDRRDNRRALVTLSWFKPNVF